MNASRRAIIHVGLHKTGSTSIQLACQDNSQLLLENGYYYPRFGEDCWVNHSVPLSLLCMDDPYSSNHTVRNMFSSPEAARSKADNIRNSFEMELHERRNCKNILISGEDISIFSKNELYNLINLLAENDYKVSEVIIYVRDPVTFALSGSQELVRAGVMSFGRALDAGNLQQAHDKIKKIENVFGKSAVRVISFERAIEDAGDISKHFFDYLGVPTHRISVVRSNMSMPLEKTLVISALCRIDGALARLASGVVSNKGSRIVASRLLEEFLIAESKNDIEYLKHCWGIIYSPQYNSPVQKLDRNILLSNLHGIRKFAGEHAGMDIGWSFLFGCLLEDSVKFFRETYRMVLVMAYNCTQEALFKNKIDAEVESGKLSGSYVSGVFQMTGDEINVETFDGYSYLKKNPDLQCVRNNLFQHYYAFGRFMGRDT